MGTLLGSYVASVEIHFIVSDRGMLIGVDVVWSRGQVHKEPAAAFERRPPCHLHWPLSARSFPHEAAGSGVRDCHANATQQGRALERAMRNIAYLFVK